VTETRREHATMERRSGEDRRSNWAQAVSAIDPLDALLRALDGLLGEMRANFDARHPNEFDSEPEYWADRLADIVNAHRKRVQK
jgi:hypothetical protein